MIEFLQKNPAYVVLTCTLIIWLGVSFYLWRIERRLSDIEKQVK